MNEDFKFWLSMWLSLLIIVASYNAYGWHQQARIDRAAIKAGLHQEINPRGYTVWVK